MENKDCVSALLALDGPATALTLVSGSMKTCSWSYAELQRQRCYVEQVLVAQGLCRGDRLLVSTTNNPHFFAILLAAIALELCLLPVHPDFSQQQLQALLLSQTPRLVIVDQLPNPSAYDQLTLLQVHESAVHWLQPLGGGVAPARLFAADNVPRVVDPPLLLFHSSGSTGQPKGMRFTRSMLNNYLGQLHELYEAFPDQGRQDKASDRVNVLPVTHFGGLSFCLLALLQGRSLYLLRKTDASQHLALLRQRRCQLLLLVPALLQELLATDAKAALPDLRHCLAMGESITQTQLQLLSERLGVRVHNAYGMSECLTGIYNRADESQVPMGSCGRLHFGEARLLAADGSEHGNEGELCVRNITTTPCYTDESLNRSKYLQGWYHTGDWFRRDAGGHYFFVGRVDLMCVINGRNVYPQEVENILKEHPAIRVCVVAPIKLSDGRLRLAAAVELAEAASMSASELVDFYLERGAVYATPAWIRFVTSLPHNGGDKPDRTSCRRSLQQDYDQSILSLSAGEKA